MKTKDINKVKELEAKFQKDWRSKDWLNIWYDIEFCCSNLTKKNTKGYYRSDIQEIVNEATFTLWCRLKKKVKKEPDYQVVSLVNYCYLPTYFTLHNPKRAFNENNVSLEKNIYGDW